MSGSNTITWAPGMPSLGRAVLAIGVFDGVHLGHQQLLEETAHEAQVTGARAVAVTFDRDPDQVVTPDAAAPQLLTLEDKCRFIAECGIGAILVVPFTPDVAQMPAEDFLDRVLGTSVDVVAIHVGEDFRFGARAEGDTRTLITWAAAHDAEARPHELFEVDGEPVTSTRIRGLVGSGDVEHAAELLGRPTRVSGRVHVGRQQGRTIGFPTANVVPVPFAALPADGVYAGWAEVAGGMRYKAAISVGTPPSFPEARDYLEAHILGFSGDLYDSSITLSFVTKVRDQRAFGSIAELTDAIAADVEAIDAALETEHAFTPTAFAARDDNDFLEDGSPVVDDPAALAAAEASVAHMKRTQRVRDESWVPVTGARHISSLFNEAGLTAALITSPLDNAGIPYAWEPYEPQDMPSFRVGYGLIDRRFTLYVPKERLGEAVDLLGLGHPAPRVPAVPGLFSDTAWTPGRIALVLFGLGLLLFLGGRAF